MTGTTWSLLHGPRSDTSSTTSTRSQLVLHGVYCMGIPPIPPVLLHLIDSQLVLRGVYCMGPAPRLTVLLLLLVHDWFYVEFTAWAL
jgi:hypothetical protein